MRAILIDPEKRTLSEIQISNDDKEHRAILQCESVTRLARIGSYEQGVDGLYVSDESYEDGPSPKLWWLNNLDREQSPFDNYPVIGRALAFGTDEAGKVVDLRISIDELTKWVRFARQTS